MRIKVCIAILYINRKLFSRSIVGHHKIYILLKGHFTINKKDQAYERPYNSRWSAQFYMQQSRSLGIFIIREHLNKALRYIQDGRIQNYATENFVGQPHIHKLRYKGGLVIQNYGKSDTVILEYVLRGPKCKNDEILVFSSMQIMASSRITRTP